MGVKVSFCGEFLKMTIHVYRCVNRLLTWYGHLDNDYILNTKDIPNINVMQYRKFIQFPISSIRWWYGTRLCFQTAYLRNVFTITKTSNWTLYRQIRLKWKHHIHTDFRSLKGVPCFALPIGKYWYQVTGTIEISQQRNLSSIWLFCLLIEINLCHNPLNNSITLAICKHSSRFHLLGPGFLVWWPQGGGKVNIRSWSVLARRLTLQ